MNGYFKLKYTRIKASQINVYCPPFTFGHNWPKYLLVQYITKYRVQYGMYTEKIKHGFKVNAVKGIVAV